MPTDNPAARLHAILKEGMAFKSDMPCRAVWAQVLGTNDESELVARLGEVMALPRQILSALEIHLPDEEIGADWARALDAGFTNQHLAGQWSSFSQHVKGPTVSFLGVISALLSRVIHIQLLPNEKLEEMTRKLRELHDLVVEGEFDEATARYLLRQIQRIQAAIDEYRITGGEPVLELVDAVYGRVMSDPDFRETMKSKGEMVLIGLAAIANVVAIATGAPPLIRGNVVPALEWLKDAALS